MRFVRVSVFSWIVLLGLWQDSAFGQPVFVQRVPGRPTPADGVEAAISDEKALEAANLKETDAAGLLGYLRTRTLSDADLSKIQAVIKRLGADDFEARLKAAVEVEKYGSAAVGPLKAAWQTDPDPEIAYRSGEALKRMEKVPHAAVAAAAVRALAKLKPPDTAAVLLGFLPLADNDRVADEIRTTLIAVAVKDGKAEPALLAGLADSVPVRRAASAVALISGGSDKELIRIKDAFGKVKEVAKSEKHIETRFQILHAMLTVARDRDALNLLVEAIPELPRGRLWQVEDFLLQLAGKDSPKIQLGRTPEALAKGRDAWKAWIEKSPQAAALEKFAYVPRIHGKMLLVLYDQRYGSGSVVELGPDLKEKWKIPNLLGPRDAAYLPDGTIAIAEQNSNRVTIRDTTGRILATRNIGGNNRVFGNPQQVQVLDSGELMVTCRNVIVVYKKDKDEEAYRYVRQQYDMVAAHRFPNGETLILLQNGTDQNIFIDDQGKEIPDRKLKTGVSYGEAYATAGGEGRVLVTEQNQVVEYDLKKNEKVWSKAINSPRFVQRLPNGNTIIIEAQSNRAIEVAPDGEEVWSYTAPAGMSLFRAYRN